MRYLSHTPEDVDAMLRAVGVESLEGLSVADDALIAHMVGLLPSLAKAQGLESGFRTIINTGKGGGQEVFHLHIHLLGGSGLPGF